VTPADALTPARRSVEAIVAGAILVLLGVVALVEARRLYHLRTTFVAGAVVGDDTFPMIVGVALLVLGVYMLVLARLPVVKVVPPRGAVRTQMLSGASLLLAYCVAVPWLGYTASTAVGSVALYRAMGGYRWPVALLLGALTTGLLYVLFRMWLLQPLPSGLLGS
jgi:tripartite tricarboxylate transporter TctB family protein